MKNKVNLAYLAIFLVFLLLGMTATSLVSAAGTLSPSDFKQESWNKTVDFFDYARDYAASHGKTAPLLNTHAYVNLAYINVNGFQLLYAGLDNITSGQYTLTVPIQTVLEHYKTPEGKDTITSSSFIMLMAFNETSDTIYPDSPDRNDSLYASFTLGKDLSGIFGDQTPPALNSKTTIVPLTASSDKLQWHWGMKYTNLTAIWWKIRVNLINPTYDVLPIAVTTYDELTFTYNLTLNPTAGNATLTSNYVIGKMTNLWLIQWFSLIPVVAHFNSTGRYLLNGTQVSDETIYQFLQNQGIKMSIVMFQNSVVFNRTTHSEADGENVTDTEVEVTNGTISTYAGDNEKIFETNFGVKDFYRLYNYTADPTETEYETYSTVTRTCRRAGFSRNAIFGVHTAFLRLVPLAVAHMNSTLYEEAKDRIANMTYADSLYVIAYPTYSGYRIEHDPTFIAYYAATATAPSRYLMLGIAAAIVAVVAVAAVTVYKRRPKTQITSQTDY